MITGVLAGLNGGTTFKKTFSGKPGLRSYGVYDFKKKVFVFKSMDRRYRDWKFAVMTYRENERQVKGGL